MIYVLLVILLIVIGALVYGLLNAESKLTVYENAIQEFYSQTSIVLHTMRGLDSKNMFESDDEVGTVFQQMNEILNTLRPLVYGSANEEKN